MQAGKPRRARQLLESWFLYDGFGGSDLYDRVRPRQNDDGDTRWVPPSVPSDRRHGQNWPLWRTHFELDQLRQESRLRIAANSYATGLLKNLVNNVIGKGFSYKARPNLNDDQKPDEELQQLVDKTQEVIDRFLRVNNWNGSIDPRGNLTMSGNREREAFRRVKRDGEAFLRFHFQDNGSTVVRWIEPEQVRDQGGALVAVGWSFGIRHRMEPVEDVETSEEFSVFWQDVSAKGAEGGHDADHGSYECVDADEVLHLKGPDTDSTIKRGTPAFVYDVGAALDRAAKVQRNASMGAQIRAATAEIWQHHTATQASISNLASGLAAYKATDAATGQQVNVERIRPGTIRRIPEDQELVPNPQDWSESYLAAGQGDLRQAAAAACAPEFWMAETSSGNYSNLESAAAPAVRDGQCEQEYYKTAYTRAVWKAVEWAAECGLLGVSAEQLAELVVIEAEAPAVLHRNELEKAQEDQILVQLGVKDRQTCAEERGLDWGKVQQANQEYTDQQGAQGMPLGMPDENGNLPPGQFGQQQQGGQQDPFGGGQGGQGVPPPRTPQLPEGLFEAVLQEAGFTGVDRHGHHWMQGKQVKKQKAQAKGRQQARQQAAPAKKTAPAAAAPPGKKGPNPGVIKTGVSPEILPHPGSVLAVAKAAGGVGGKVGAAVGAAEHWVHHKLAQGLDKLPPAVGKNARRVWNVLMATYSGGYDAVKAYGVEMGKSEAEATRIAGIVSAVDAVLAKPAVLGAELTGIPGLSLAVGYVPIASTAYLGVAAARHPIKVARAAVAAAKGFLDRVANPDKYKATAQKHHEGKEAQPRFDQNAVGKLWDQLDHLDDEAKEWYTALLYAAVDYTGGNLNGAVQLATDVLHSEPIPEVDLDQDDE